MCGGGKGLQQTSQTMALPSFAAMGAYNTAMDRIAAATSQPFQKYSSDPTAYVASLTPTQRGAISNVSGMAGMTDPYFQGATALTAAGAAPVGRLTSGQIQEYMSPYMSQVIDPVTAALKQQQGQQLSQQQTESIRGGAFGGERAGLQRAILRGQQQLGLGQALSPLFAQGYGQALQTAQGQQGIEAANLQRLLGAGAQIGGLGTAAQQAALQQASAQLQAGTLEQQTETAQKQALYNEFQKQRMYPLQTAQLYAQAAGSLGPLMGSTSQGYQQMPFFGGFAADGGAIKGYDEGLGAARMGGAVIDLEPGKDYFRGGYADGGDLGLGALVAQHKAAVTPQLDDVQFPTGEIRASRPLEPTVHERQQSGGLGSLLSKGADIARKGFDVREKLSKLPDGASFLDKASTFFADGGEVSDDGMSDILNNPIQTSKPLVAEQPQKKEGSGLGGLLKTGASLAANYFLPGSGALVSGGLSALGMADGGRAEYADGGPGYDPELDYMARTMIKEAGDQGDTGMAAVGHVGMNRLLSGRYGKSLQDVFTAPKQFSPWNQEARGTKADPRLIDPASRSYQHAYDIARRVREGEIEDPTGGATHFYAQKLVNPKWAQGVDPTAVIGGHTFLRADAGADQAALGRAGGLIPKGDPRRSFEASYKGPQAASPQKKTEEGGFTEHPERLIVPILQGLGAMAGSKNRYALGAIAEGLGAGAGSYMETGKALEEQRKTHEEADLLRASGLEAGAGALKTLREMPIWVNPANPGQSLVMTSSGAVMDLNAYLTMQNPPPLMGAQEASLAAQQLGLREKGTTQAGYAPEGGVMPTGLNAVRQAGAEGEEPAVETARDIAGGTPGVPQKQITPPAKPMAYVGINLGEAAASAPAQERSYINSIGGKAAFESSQEIRRDINQKGSAARAQAIYNSQISQIMAEAAAAKGFEAMGDYSDARARITNTLNTMARGLGYGDSFFGQNESRNQMLEKLNSIRGEATVIGAGQPAYKALETVISAMPGTGQTQRSGSFNAASNMVQNQKKIDYQNYSNAYGQKTGNLYNNVEDAFASDNPDDKYNREEDAFQKIIRSPNGSKLLEHFMKGEKPDGSKASKADIDAFFKNKFDLDGMSRYFMGARGG